MIHFWLLLWSWFNLFLTSKCAKYKIKHNIMAAEQGLAIYFTVDFPYHWITIIFTLLWIMGVNFKDLKIICLFRGWEEWEIFNICTFLYLDQEFYHCKVIIKFPLLSDIAVVIKISLVIPAFGSFYIFWSI